MKEENLNSNEGTNYLLSSSSLIRSQMNNKKRKACFIVPVGEQIKPLMFGFRYVSDVDKVFLLCSQDTEEIADAIYEKIKEVYDCEKIIINPSSFDIIIDVVFPKIKDYDRYIINLTGGTKIMVLASYFFAQLKESYCFYIFKTQDEKMIKFDVPVVSLPEKINILYEKIMEKSKKKKILELISDYPKPISELAKLLKIKKPTLIGHLKTLERWNITTRVKKGNITKVVITPTGKVIFSILSKWK